MKVNIETKLQNLNTNIMTTNSTISTKVGGGNRMNCVYELDNQINSVENFTYGDESKNIDQMNDLFAIKLDVDVERKMMTIMSHCMSEEDYKKAMEGGFSPSEMDVEKLVTIVDHIKTEMAKAGVIVAGYNNGLDETTLKEVVGDLGQAKQIMEALEQNDLPINLENIKAIHETIEKSKEIAELQDGSKKYLIEKGLELSVDSLYKATYSAFGEEKKQGQFYYAQECKGYFAEKASMINWEKMTAQLKTAISQMTQIKGQGEEQLENAKWLMEKGLAVNEKNMLQLEHIKELKIPLETTNVIKAAVDSITRGNTAGRGSLLNKGENIYQKGERLYQSVQTLKSQSIAICIKEEKLIHLHNLVAAQSEFEMMQQEEKEQIQTYMSEQLEFASESKRKNDFITAKRQLLEVQLSMTTNINVQLIKGDFPIDTAPLSKLVETLKEQELKIEKQLFEDTEEIKSENKLNLFYKSNRIIKEIPALPAKVIGTFMSSHEDYCLSDIHERGISLKKQYDEIQKKYEALMTKPRADMGDRIQDAFRNVDDILEDLDLEKNEDNRKSLRILGYNELEVSEENLFKVKDKYLQLENIIKTMTPNKTLELIREGINPLTISMEELEDKLKSMDSKEEENKKFARFLYEMEQKKEITGAERESYIGIYRLFRQIEKTDAAAIGGLVEQGADLTLGNLLTAMRNRKNSNKEYVIDDQFGGIQAKAGERKTISEQIEAASMEKRMLHAVYRDLSVSALEKLEITEELSLSDLREAQRSEEKQEISREELKAEKQLMDASLKTNESVKKMIEAIHLPFTAENVVAAEQLFKKETQIYQLFREIEKAKTDEKNSSIKKEDIEEIIEHCNSKDEWQNCMEQWETKLSQQLENMSQREVDQTIDLRKIQSSYKQLSVMTAMRKEDSYHVPMKVGDEISSVHLTFLHDERQKGSVKITTENEIFGKVAVKYQLDNQEIRCFGLYEKEEKQNQIHNFCKKTEIRLREEGFQITEQRFVKSEKELDLLTFLNGTVDNNNKQEKTSRLYTIAKVFLEEINSLS